MTLSPTVTELVAAYEQEHGCKPADLVLQIAEHILKVGKMLTNLGQKDAQEGKTPYPADVFPALVIKAFRMDFDEDHETVQAVADLWQSDYMDGYNSAMEGCSVWTKKSRSRPPVYPGKAPRRNCRGAGHNSYSR